MPWESYIENDWIDLFFTGIVPTLPLSHKELDQSSNILSLAGNKIHIQKEFRMFGMCLCSCMCIPYFVLQVSWNMGNMIYAAEPTPLYLSTQTHSIKPFRQINHLLSQNSTFLISWPWIETTCTVKLFVGDVCRKVQQFSLYFAAWCMGVFSCFYSSLCVVVWYVLHRRRMWDMCLSTFISHLPRLLSCQCQMNVEIYTPVWNNHHIHSFIQLCPNLTMQTVHGCLTVHAVPSRKSTGWDELNWHLGGRVSFGCCCWQLTIFTCCVVI